MSNMGSLRAANLSLREQLQRAQRELVEARAIAETLRGELAEERDEAERIDNERQLARAERDTLASELDGYKQDYEDAMEGARQLTVENDDLAKRVEELEASAVAQEPLPGLVPSESHRLAYKEDYQAGLAEAEKLVAKERAAVVAWLLKCPSLVNDENYDTTRIEALLSRARDCVEK